MQTKTWNVDVFLFEEDGRTHAEAVLRTHTGPELRHVGTAYKSPTTGTFPRSETSSPCAVLSTDSPTTSWTPPSWTSRRTTPRAMT